MTNWKDEDQSKHKAKKRDKDHGKRKSEGDIKKAANAAKTAGKIKASFRRKISSASGGNDVEQKQASSESPQTQPEFENTDNKQTCESPNVIKEEPEPVNENLNEVQKTEAVPEVKEETKPEVTKSEGKTKRHGKHGKSKKQAVEEVKKEQTPTQVEDPQAVLKNKVFQVVKNAFSLAYTEEEELRISVDNIFPLLKALGLNPQSESVVDLVRDACMESAGDIDPKDFERVVLALIKELDDDLWLSRLEEKQFLHWEAEAKIAKLEAERLRLEQERQKAGFETLEEDVDEWEEYERQKKEEEEKKIKELKEDELYDNMKMAFRFIDADGDGVISTKDLYTLMMGVGEMLTDDELFGMVNMADADCDGKVTFEDFKRFLSGKDAEEEKPAVTLPTSTEPTQDAVTNQPKDAPDASTEQATTVNESEDTIKTAEVKPEVKQAETEVSEEEKERQLRRRKSMLWGYTRTATKLAVTIDEKRTEEKKDAIKEEETDKSAEEKSASLDKVSEESETTEEEDTKPESNNSGDSGNCLDAIREEDEHSNYDMDNVPNMKSDNKTGNLAENKRKIFSRQSSAASLKNKPNSTAESLDDSGIDTLDTNCGSEIREQPDVFDISDEESGRVRRRRRARSARQQQGDIYTGNEDDEDMVNPRYVHESLSRVSSMESLEDELNVLDENVTGKDNEDVPNERTRNFVEKHMYVEVEPVVDEAELLLEQERLRRADVLQKAILRRSATTPNLTVCTSRTSRPQTARPSVNGYACSHIDIDLRCDSPPKADIKSMKKFAARIRSAKDPIQGFDRAFIGRHMSVVDLCETANTDDNLTSQRDLPKFPSRPLTRPRSPTQKRVMSARERPLRTPLPPNCDKPYTEIPERAKSAVPFLRETPSRPVTPRRIIKRPLTAQIPYTGSRRMEKAFSKFDKSEDLTVVVSQPFLNSDELYPNKTLFTQHHHGFKSIWPIGRKINVIQNKRPFSAFEMNSYSRAIERNELPFKKDANIVEDVVEQIPVEEIKPVVKDTKPKKKTLIKLELNTDGLRRPVARKITTLIRTGLTPRSVR